MTMPSKIWYGRDYIDGARDRVWKPSDVSRLKNREPRGQSWQEITEYTSADIARDLLETLIEISSSKYGDGTTKCVKLADDALDRYNAAMEGAE